MIVAVFISDFTRETMPWQKLLELMWTNKLRLIGYPGKDVAHVIGGHFFNANSLGKAEWQALVLIAEEWNPAKRMRMVRWNEGELFTVTHAIDWSDTFI